MAAVVFIGDRSINIYIWRPISEVSERTERCPSLDNCLETIKQHAPLLFYDFKIRESRSSLKKKKK